MPESPFTDRATLTTRAYAEPDKLVTRYSLYEYRRPPLDPHAIAARLMHEVPGPVLDVGCGPGRAVRALRTDRPDRTAVAVDLSPGMIAAAGAPGIVADAAALPVADGSCGGLLAMHMLYHVSPPDRAVRELARAKAPGGTVLISTNAEDDKVELYELCQAAVAQVPGMAGWDASLSRQFGLDTAEAVAREHFASVRRLDYTGEVVVPDPEALVRFVASLDVGAPAEAFGVLLDEVRRRACDAIARDGAVRLGTHIGILLCR